MPGWQAKKAMSFLPNIYGISVAIWGMFGPKPVRFSHPTEQADQKKCKTERMVKQDA